MKGDKWLEQMIKTIPVTIQAYKDLLERLKKEYEKTTE